MNALGIAAGVMDPRNVGFFKCRASRTYHLSQKKAMRLQYQVHLIMRYFLIITACVKHNTHDTKRVHNIHMFLLLLFSEMSQD